MTIDQENPMFDVFDTTSYVLISIAVIAISIVAWGVWIKEKPGEDKL
jgi:hypothetical protein